MADASVHDHQAVVALATIASMVVIAAGALVLAYFAPKEVADPALLIASGIGGALCNSLTAPNGVAAALRAAGQNGGGTGT